MEEDQKLVNEDQEPISPPSEIVKTSEVEVARRCKTCSGDLVWCPSCGGNDTTEYAGLGQQVGYYICQNKDCEDYQFCCGC